MVSINKPAKAKRAPLPRRADYTRQFGKDWEKLTHSGKQDMQRLKATMLLLIYRLEADSVIFVRAGTHSELFGR